MPRDALLDLQSSLLVLEEKKSFSSARQVAIEVVKLLLPDLGSPEVQLFRDSDGKITANASWFQYDEEISDRRATYSVATPPEANLDVKIFGIGKPSSSTISWAAGLTPNFEDEPFNSKFDIGIDFFVPESKDRVIVALSKNYIVRTLELKGLLTPTYLDILNSWTTISDTSKKSELHHHLWNSFDLQPINKRFYEGISQRFIQLRQHLQGQQILDTNHAAQFVNRLIGRVIFAWFLEKKSLLDQDRGYFQPEGFDDDTAYYREKLESLFFEVLNTPVSDRKVLDLHTPYLNGGLFEPKLDDLYKSQDLTFPRNYFEEFFAFLRSYNFTTDESTSEFQQVAIDPEMLGRIFENLLAEVSEETGAQARKAKGAFYTPREVVDYMCRESLKTFLRSKVPVDENLERRLYQLVDAPDREFQDQDHNWRRDFKPYRDDVLRALDNLKILDPACGSGAFPIGMLQLLVRVYGRVESRFDPQKAKLGIIDRNLYGVDIEPMAVEISRLRTWLALVVEQENGKIKVEPLPNLDFKFVCANSLLSLDETGYGYLAEDVNLEEKLQTIRALYFGTQDARKKKSLQVEYQELVEKELTFFGDSNRTNQLKSFQPFESDRVADFFNPGHMFGVEYFDIVIGNPPYIGESSNKDLFRRVKDSKLGKRFAQSKMDYFYYFFHLAIDLTAESGVICFITTNYFPTATSATLLRSEIRDKANVLKLINFNELKIFKSAAGQHNLISLFQKTEPNPDHLVQTCISERRGEADSSTLGLILGWLDDESSYFSIKQQDLFWGERVDMLMRGSRPLDLILEKISKTSESLKTISTITQGIQTGANSVFVFEETPGLLKRSEAVMNGFIKTLYKNSDIYRFGCKQSEQKLLYLPNGINLESLPELHEYLLTHKDLLKNRAQILRSGHPWYELLWPREQSTFEPKPKVVAPYRARVNSFFYTEKECYGSTDTYFISSDSAINLKIICACLNSSLGLVWFKNMGKNKGSMLDLTGDNLKLFPIPPQPLSREATMAIASLVDHLTALLERGNVTPGKKASSPEYESSYKQLDQLVMAAYGLSEEEQEVIAVEARRQELSAAGTS